MIPLDSTCLAAVDYNPASRTLIVQFCSGPKPYSYFGVPPHTFHGLLMAPSHGRYFHAHIAGRYRRTGHPPDPRVYLGPSPFATAPNRIRPDEWLKHSRR